ncbi:MAG: GatB/YqeY domain-containing protein [Anaerolinea sp.]|nr:GatB/YqeY domain-containing protein [Anaerolinea sp.]
MENPREKLNEALKQAMLNKDTQRRDVIRVALSAIKQVEVDERRELTAEDVLAVLQKEVKKRRESIDEAVKAGRQDIAEATAAEVSILESFLPRQLSRDEIAALVREAIAATGAASPKDMGKVMAIVVPKTRGIADGKLVNEVVRELLAQ